MAEDDLVQQDNDLEHEIDIDTDEEGDLETAMQEALEAVEKASQGGGGPGSDERRTQAAASGAATPSQDEDVLRLEEEIADLRDRSARTLADFDNYRKRIDREREEDRKYAAFDLLKEFLVVVDNLERALAADGPESDLKAGVELILRQMKDLMRTVGVERIESVGEEFDPRYHEAVTQHEDREVDTPTVSDELQPGYLIYDRLLRPAVVKVAMPVEASSNGSAEGAD